MAFLSFIIILCAMIVIHEFGHFIVAKLLGISVETFSVGFGPKLWGFKIGETDYRVSAIPLGGYVKFRGENMELLQGKSEGSVDEFLSHAKWKRFLVALAGPAFNIATALMIPTISILIGYHASAELMQKPVIGSIVPGSAAEKSGLQSGDRIISFHGKANPTWRDIDIDTSLHPEENLAIKVDRGGQIFNLNLIPQAKMIERERIGDSGIEPYVALDGVHVFAISPGMPAEQAGLKVGDRITTVNGQQISAWHQFKNELRKSNGQSLTLKVERGGNLIDLHITPVMQNGEYRVGFTRQDATVLVQTSSLAAALRYGVDSNWMIIRMSGVALQQIISGHRSPREALGGPVRIAQETINTYDAFGWTGIINLMGMLSLNLGIINLFPIPVLDGGVIMLIIVEWIMGLVGFSITMNVRERIQQVGFVMVLLLMGFVIVNDLVNVGRGYFNKPAQEQPVTQPAK
ncbi:MAG: site-2 protease family protein [Blastocatellia bacterium]|nr:site-2 protease family protein [Blastocatellia bacterium]